MYCYSQLQTEVSGQLQTSDSLPQMKGHPPVTTEQDTDWFLCRNKIFLPCRKSNPDFAAVQSFDQPVRKSIHADSKLLSLTQENAGELYSVLVL